MTTTNRTNFASGAGLSRRALVAGAGATGLALAGGRRVFAAGAENTLKVGFISPRTGALGGFGQTDGYVLDVVRQVDDSHDAEHERQAAGYQRVIAAEQHALDDLVDEDHAGAPCLAPRRRPK